MGTGKCRPSASIEHEQRPKRYGAGARLVSFPSVSQNVGRFRQQVLIDAYDQAAGARTVLFLFDCRRLDKQTISQSEQGIDHFRIILEMMDDTESQHYIVMPRFGQLSQIVAVHPFLDQIDVAIAILPLVLQQVRSTITHADQIVVVEDGTIKEIGRHDELMRANGIYARLYNVQHLHDVPNR